MYRIHRAAAALLIAAAVVACETPVERAALPQCPPSGRATARALAGDAVHFTGDHAVGGAGDWILQNDRAAFVVQGVDRGISYYHYGGILVDAVPMSECRQTSPDRFEELGILLGSLDATALWRSTLRAFRAESIRVVRDGRDGGPAIVRAVGRDDYYWLVEYTLVGLAQQEGDPKPLSGPLGIRIEVDYILQPDSPVLEIVLRVVGESDRKLSLMAGFELLFGDETRVTRVADASLDFGGFSFATGIPWLAAGSLDGRGAWAFTMPGRNMSAAHISGIDAVFDLDQALTSPMRLRSAGDSEEMRMLVAVAPGDLHSVSGALAALADAAGGAWQPSLEPLFGEARDESGRPATDVEVEMQILQDDDWSTLDRYRVDTDGRFGPARVYFRNQAFPTRLIARSAGREASVPVTPDAQGRVRITAPPAGRLLVDIRDAAGTALPGKVQLWRDGVRHAQHFLYGRETVPAPPGLWDVVVTRGYEYARVETQVTIPEDGDAVVTAALVRLVDTDGWLSIDTHVHSGPSADSPVPIPTRIRAAAAEGLEVPVATDHEAIVGLQAGIDSTGLHDFVATITGEEVTATLPEHLTMFPVVPDGTLRGGIIEWYTLGLPELFEAMYARGAKIAMINHPGSLYRILEWDRIAGKPGIARYADLQMISSKAPWSWNFDGVEVLNGFTAIFRRPGDHPSVGHFDNWMSFHNHGHRIVGVAASDVHGFDDTGYPRSYFATDVERLRELRPDAAVAAFKSGRVLMSAGAFARVSAGGKSMGDTLTAGSGTFDLQVRIEALPEIDVTHIRVFANCDEIVHVAATAPDQVVKFDAPLTVTLATDAHLVVAAFGRNAMPRGLPDYDPTRTPRVLTNPLFVDVDGNGRFDAPGGRECSYTRDDTD